MIDAWRLAVGTLTVVPVRAPALGRTTRTPGRAMLLAPVVGLLLGAVAAGVGLLADAAGLDAAVVAVLVLGCLALLTRGLHLDGLADTADGLGSSRSAERALEVMRRPDIGPFGVVTVVLVLLVQAAALAQTWAAGLGAAAVVTAAMTGRCAIPLACRRGIPGARPDGLGAVVAGSVRPAAAVAAAALCAALAAVLLRLDGGSAWRGALSVVVALVAAWIAQRHVVRRLGGITGDVLGALVEVAAMVTLLVLGTS